MITEILKMFSNKILKLFKIFIDLLYVLCLPIQKDKKITLKMPLNLSLFKLKILTF